MRNKRTMVCVSTDKIQIFTESVLNKSYSIKDIIKLLKVYGASEKEIVNFVNDLAKLDSQEQNNTSYN